MVGVAYYLVATSELAQTTLRAAPGNAELDGMLAARERRAEVSRAEGEKPATQAPLDAAQMLTQRPEAMQLHDLKKPGADGH